MAWLLLGMALVAWVLLAAKAHGRQVRLEREAIGVVRVDFGGTNPPEVEAIWRRDRLVFWSAMGTISIFLGAVAWWTRDLELGVAALPMAFASSFVVAGLASWARLGGGDWRSFGWWTLVAAAVALAALALRT